MTSDAATSRDHASDGPQSRDSAGNVAVDVPRGAPVYECSRCGRPFESEDYLALHRGLVHGEDLDEAEREAFDAARDAESAAIRRFRLKAIGVVILVYFVLLMVYALV